MSSRIKPLDTPGARCYTWVMKMMPTTDKPCRAYAKGDACRDGRDHCCECGRHLDADSHCAYCENTGRGHRGETS